MKWKQHDLRWEKIRTLTQFTFFSRKLYSKVKTLFKWHQYNQIKSQNFRQSPLCFYLELKFLINRYVGYSPFSPLPFCYSCHPPRTTVCKIRIHRQGLWRSSGANLKLLICKYRWNLIISSTLVSWNNCAIYCFKRVATKYFPAFLLSHSFHLKFSLLKKESVRSF